MSRLFRLIASAFHLNCKKDYRLRNESDSDSDSLTESSFSSLIQYEDCFSTIDESIVIGHEQVDHKQLELSENLEPTKQSAENCSVILQHELSEQPIELSVNSLTESKSIDLKNHSSNMSVNVENGSSYPNRYAILF